MNVTGNSSSGIAVSAIGNVAGLDAKGIFILPPSLEELQSRLEKRGRDNAEVIASRMDKAKREISHFDEYDYLIVNDNFDEALLALRSIILANRQKREQQQLIHEDLINSLLQDYVAQDD